MSTTTPPPLNASFSILQDDSSSSGPFEGPEKLIELWFSASVDSVPKMANSGTRLSIPGVLDGALASEKMTGLRTVPKETWHKMLDEVKCKVLSVVESEEVDAYLLSESSMFVWPHKLILKTCGTTTLLLGLRTLLNIAKDVCGFPGVWRCFYSRKTFMFPERQLGPHKAWGQEVNFLDGIFENGSAYTVGKMNGDHWLLYVTPPRADVLIPPVSVPASALATSTAKPVTPTTPMVKAAQRINRRLLLCPAERDSTLEILMSGLSPAACAQFYATHSPVATRYPDEPPSEGHSPGLALAEALGLDACSLLGGGQTDAFLFSPCGFSANMIGGTDGCRYATIHVTPEAEYSYASFECNVDYSGRANELVQVVDRVLGVFGPNRMSVTLFVSHEDDDEQRLADRQDTPAHEGIRTVLGHDLVASYKRTDRIVYEFEGYDLVFATFERL